MADSPLVCTVGTLTAGVLVAGGRLGTAVDTLTVVPDLVAELVTLVVGAVLEGAVAAATAVGTGALRADLLEDVDALTAAAGVELGGTADELAEAGTGDTIEAPGVSDEAEVP